MNTAPQNSPLHEESLNSFSTGPFLFPLTGQSPLHRSLPLSPFLGSYLASPDSHGRCHHLYGSNPVKGEAQHFSSQAVETVVAGETCQGQLHQGSKESKAKQTWGAHKLGLI